jgi:membrane-associated phospholipid phosphatase
MIREFKGATLPLLTLLLLLCVSTVYGRFHYISDVVVGLILGAIALLMTSLWHRLFLSLRARDSRLRENNIEPALETGVKR